MSSQEIEFPAEATSLPEIFTWVTTSLKNTPTSSKRKTEIELAMEEIIVNIIHHAYDDKPGKLTLSQTVAAQSITFTIKDWGKPFDPTEPPNSLNPNASLVDRKEGGLGLHITHKYVSEMHYKSEGKVNCLVLHFKY